MSSARMDKRIIHWTKYLVATTEGSTVATSRPFCNGAFVPEWKRKEDGRGGEMDG